MDLRITLVDAGTTRPLRHAVLRPHQGIADLAEADAARPDALHVAASDAGGDVVGTAVVMPEDPPCGFEAPRRVAGASWRLRGMATREDVRGRGVGAAVLGSALALVAGRGGGLVWCNARLPARSFYRRAGFVEWGAPWVEPEIGPHVVMWRVVEPAESPERADERTRGR